MPAPIFMIDVELNDREGNRARMRFGCRHGLSFGNAELRAQRLVAALQEVSDAVVKSYTIYKSFPLDPDAPPVAESDVNRKAVLIVSLENDYMGVFLIPSLDRALLYIDANSDRTWLVDWSRPEWAALENALIGTLSQTGLPITGVVIGGEAH